MIDYLQLAKRIEERPPTDLIEIIAEYRDYLPECIRIEDRIRKVDVLGQLQECVLVVEDPVLGCREYCLSVFQATGETRPSAVDPTHRVEKYLELTDETNAPLWSIYFGAGKRAVVDCLRAVATQWVRIATEHLQKDKSTWSRHAKQPDAMIQNRGHGEWYVHRSALERYVKPQFLNLYR